MPMLAVNLPQKTFAEIMNLVGQGSYETPEQFLEIAAFNQLALERGLKPDQLTKGIYKPAAIESEALAPVVDKKPRTADSPKLQTPNRQRRVQFDVDQVDTSQVFMRLAQTDGGALAVKLAEKDPNAGSTRIWGQVNRLFPMKLATRWILVFAARHGAWPTLQETVETLAEDAATIGTLLEKSDGEHNRKREDMLSTGLPRRGNLQSRDRFLSQFVVRINRADQIYPGAIWQYGLAVVSEDRFHLTDGGHALASLPNPILDHSYDSWEKTLFEDEKRLFGKLIQEQVDAERNDFAEILSAIVAGNSTPDTLLEAIRPAFPSQWTDVALRTHLYGILARLSDLGTLSKEWNGRRVRYQVMGTALPSFALEITNDQAH